MKIDESISDRTSLRQLVATLCGTVDTSATSQKVFILNEVPDDFYLPGEQERVIAVIGDMLTTMVANARETCISVTAERYADMLVLHVEDQNNFNGYALSFSMIAVEREARCAGGNISIEGAMKRVATVSFTFPVASVIRNQVFCS